MSEQVSEETKAFPTVEQTIHGRKICNGWETAHQGREEEEFQQRIHYTRGSSSELAAQQSRREMASH